MLSGPFVVARKELKRFLASERSGDLKRAGVELFLVSERSVFWVVEIFPESWDGVFLGK